MEVAPNIHRIEAPLGDRFVCVYLLVGTERSLLIDTGIDSTPGDYIAPYLDVIGMAPSQVRYVLTSHSDFDHTAGNGALRALAPNALFLCHTLDRPMVEDIELMISDRYGEFCADHGVDESEETKAFIRAHSQHVPVDMALSGGEQIHLGADWHVSVLHTPGHTRGHLSLHDARSRSLIIADAALYNAVLRKDGTHAFPPTYRYVDSYVSTIHRFQTMPIDTLLTSHYPVYRDAGVQEFLGESRAFVERMDAAIQGELANGARPYTAQELINTLAPRMGQWPPDAYPAFIHPLYGHLERMMLYGLVQPGQRDGLMTFMIPN